MLSPPFAVIYFTEGFRIQPTHITKLVGRIMIHGFFQLIKFLILPGRSRLEILSDHHKREQAGWEQEAPSENPPIAQAVYFSVSLTIIQVHVSFPSNPFSCFFLWSWLPWKALENFAFRADSHPDFSSLCGERIEQAEVLLPHSLL